MDAPDRERSAGGSQEIESEHQSEEDDDTPQDEGQNDQASVSTERLDRRRPHPRPHPRPRPRRRFPVCLTNGTTVMGWRNISSAFQNDSSIGIRCLGKCEWCANITKCPRVPTEAEQQKMKERHMRKMQELGKRWMAMTVESPEKAGDCSCVFKGEKRESSRFQQQRHHMAMEWSVCGTNNVTFDNMCSLVNAQSQAKNLGFRCHGKCPCPEDEFDGKCHSQIKIQWQINWCELYELNHMNNLFSQAE